MSRIPELLNPDYGVQESFDEYMAKWPYDLSHYPREFIQQWCYEHNDEVLEYWSDLVSPDWRFTFQQYSIDKIKSIDHLTGRINEIIERAEQNLHHPNGGKLQSLCWQMVPFLFQ